MDNNRLISSVLLSADDLINEINHPSSSTGSSTLRPGSEVELLNHTTLVISGLCEVYTHVCMG